MKCPRCATPTKVLDTRTEGSAYLRRRECEQGHRIWTRESVVQGTPQNKRGAAMRAAAQAKKDKAAELYQSGALPKAIALDLNVQPSRIYTWIKKLGWSRA